MSPPAPFRNEPVLELRRAAARQQLAAGMDELEPQLPLRVPLWIGADRRDGHDAVDVARVGRDERFALAAVAADPERHAQRQLRLELVHPGGQLLARGRAAQLEDGFVAERSQRAHGAARSLSIDAPLACSARNDSLDVFSSSRRTR